ncbi:MAG: transglutaminase family protein [Rhodospirillales bacterium]
MIYAVTHETVYEYAFPVSISHHLLHMAPRFAPNQTVRSSGLTVFPQPEVSSNLTDYFGNPASYVTIQQDHTKLVVQANCMVEVTAQKIPNPADTPAWETVPPHIAGDFSPDGLDIFQYVFDSPHTVAGEAVSDYARISFTPGRPVLEAAMDLMTRIFKDFKYEGDATDVTTSVDEVLAMKKGVCQDFAHLQIAAMRSLGLAARYVSGYILTYPKEGEEKLVGADASHAWISIYVPNTGWVDLDPTNNKACTDEHITIAWGRDYADVSPINGYMLGGGAHEVKVAVDVRPIRLVET